MCSNAAPVAGSCAANDWCAAWRVVSTDEPACAAREVVWACAPTVLRYTDDITLPSTAMPSAPPSSRDRSLTAEPTPDLARGTDDMMSVVDGALVWPPPKPMHANAAPSRR